MVPTDVMQECRARAAEAAGKPRSRAGAIAIVAIWLALAAVGIAALTDVVY
jgi:hypothetical protein